MKKKKRLIKCIVCGKEFYSSRLDVYCCSSKCSIKANNNLLIEEIKEEQELEKKELKHKIEIMKKRTRVMNYINSSYDLRELSYKSDVGLNILESIKIGLYGITDVIVERCYKALEEVQKK